MRWEGQKCPQLSSVLNLVSRAGLYCLLNTDEGVILEDSISMFYNLALTRLELTETQSTN